jgi:hypothetical protein
MPNAKTEACKKAPPEKASINPRAPFFAPVRFPNLFGSMHCKKIYV